MGAADLLYHLRSVGLMLTVTSEGGLHVAPKSVLTDEQRAAIRGARDALVRHLEAEAQQERSSTVPLLTPEQGDRCHAGGWDDAEIEAFKARDARFARMGRNDSTSLAERLVLRDRDKDDRRLCLECASLTDRGRCGVAQRGQMIGADRRLEPVQVILQRCPYYSLAPGLT